MITLEIKLNNYISIWKLDQANNYGQPTKVNTGSIIREYQYNNYGIHTGRTAKVGQNTAFQNHTYNFDIASGNLTFRKDNKYNLQEDFDYDGLNRMTDYGNNTATYNEKGNITKKSDIGSSFNYNIIGKPYAISNVSRPTDAISQVTQTVTYNSFKRPQEIVEGNKTALFTYNAKGSRVGMSLLQTDPESFQRYGYLSDCYERVENYHNGGVVYCKEKLYLGGNYYNAPAIYVKDGNNNWQLYYICRDYLGSITHITDASGNVIEENSYDAWGRRRNPANYDEVHTSAYQATPFLGRGYTGHEHLPQFGLINMNARLYDPAVGRFLSPDPYVQLPDFSQSYNRYSYALNNPMCYVDESGEFWFIPVIVGAVIGAYVGASVQSGTAACWNWQSDAWKGAIAGGIIGATLGYGFSAAIGAAGMTTASGSLTQSAGIVSSMLNSGSINIGINALSGGGWDGAWKAGVVGLASGAWGATGGFGMVKAWGAENTFAQLGGKLGYQMIGTAGSSIGNNWAMGEDPFSRVTLGVGPVNLTLGKDQKLLQWQNNLGNIVTNALGLGNLAFGGKMEFAWKNLAPIYSGGVIDKLSDPRIAPAGFGAHSVMGNSRLFKDRSLYPHELHHLWQSRAFGDAFILNYGLQGINAMLMKGGSFFQKYNYFEDQAYNRFWW